MALTCERPHIWTTFLLHVRQMLYLYTTTALYSLLYIAMKVMQYGAHAYPRPLWLAVRGVLNFEYRVLALQRHAFA